jgi:predicted 2-oxoglutarate/Fe(II)-dependent dioxygenase YbiX
VPDAPSLDALLHDLTRLLPEDERASLTRGARLRRQSLALAKRLGVAPSADAVRAAAAAFRRARGLTRADALAAWCRDRDVAPEDFARLMTEEATLAAMGDAADVDARDLADLLRVADGGDALWAEARLARDRGPSDAPALELLHGWYEGRLGALVPDEERIERDAHARGFDDADALLAALARTSPPVLFERSDVARGDALPDFVLRHPDAGDVRPDLFAGRWWALVLGELPGAAATARSLATLDGLLLDESSAYVGDVTLPETWSAVPDLERTVRTRCRLPSAETVALLVAPCGRVAEVVRDVTASPVAARFEAARASWGAAHAPVLVVPEAFEASLCEALIRAWETGEREAGRVTAGGAEGVGHRVARDIKRRTDHVVRDARTVAMIRERLARRVLPEMRRAFGYEAMRCEGFRVGCYEASDGGVFHPHRDDANPATAGRRFALSVNLRHGSYAGGKLVLPEYDARFDAATGSAVVYGASVLHAVEPVTAGRRYALVGFFL